MTRESADIRPAKLRLAIALTLVTASVLASGVACSSGSKAKPQVETTATATELTPNPSEPTRPLFVKTPIASAQSRDAFAALWLASQRATYKVRYDTSAEGGQPSDSYVVFNRPPGARVDTIAPGATEPSSQIIVGRDGTTFGCSFDGGKRSCSKIDAFRVPLPLAAGPIIFPADSSFGSITVAELDSQTIAGAPARCFRVLPGSADGDTAADYCFSANAVPVYASGPSGIIVATEVSSASDDDVALPAS